MNASTTRTDAYVVQSGGIWRVHYTLGGAWMTQTFSRSRTAIDFAAQVREGRAA